jgi:hypothetical protein
MVEWRTLVTTKANRIPEWFQHLYEAGVLNGKDGANGVDGTNGTHGVSILGAGVQDDRFLISLSNGKFIDVGSSEFFRGEKGNVGQQGVTGPVGPHGATGVPGEQGARGKRGCQGDQGKMGLQGKPGKNARNGKDGKDGRMPKHQIKDGKLRFEQAPNKWGEWIEIKPLTAMLNSGGNSASIYDANRYKAIRTLTVDATLHDTDNTIACKDNAVSITLYNALAGYSDGFGNIHTIKNAKSNTNDVTLIPASGETIDGESSWIIPPGAAPKIQTDGIEWHII